MKRNYCLFVLLVLILGIGGCSRKVIIRKYYLLEVPSSSLPVELDLENPYEFQAVVQDFRVAKAFQQTRIAVRSASHELNYYYYHHWAVRPSASVTEFVFYLVDHAGLFNRCSRGYAADADFVITGEIHAIERLQTHEIKEAHLSMTFLLLEAKTERSLLRYDADRRSPFEENNMNEFAGQMSRLLREETEVFIQQVAEFLKTYEKSSVG